MKILPEGLLPRILAVLLVSLVATHLGSVYLYHSGLENELDLANEQRLAERIASVRRAVTNVTPDSREELAHSLATESIEIHWSDSYDNGGAIPSNGYPGLKAKVYELLPDLRGTGLEIYDGSALPGHATASRFTLINVPLPDKSIASFALTPAAKGGWNLDKIIFSTTLMVLGVMAVATISIRSLTRSLRKLANFADIAMPGDEPASLTGREPTEVRLLGEALNRMQGRLRLLLNERTETLAAISHDLKSPLARMQLRIEDIEDAALAGSLNADVVEMHAMLDSALEFLRGERDGEAKRPVDLSPLLETICSDIDDAGGDVRFDAEQPVVVLGKHLALKRALANVIENAIKYGGHARVKLDSRAGFARLTVEDGGPGIPEDQLEQVFRPFYRVEPSRNRETGGVGLGLTVAKTVVVAHGGEVTLENSGTGLRATITVPLYPGSEMI